MGKILNTGNAEFAAVRKEEYVDKSMLIAYVNSVLGSLNKYMCVSRARRFGKSIAAKMLCAYYDESVDSRALFADLKIAQDPSYEEHRNKYPVIYLDIASFMTKRSLRSENIVDAMSNELKEEIVAAYPEVELDESKDLSDLLWRVWDATGKQFIMIIDEWDAICRDTDSRELMQDYITLLRDLFKSNTADRFLAGVYMTGILPIKQYDTQSALNNVEEFSMTDPGELAGYFGFTREEVHALCEQRQMDEEQIKQWYDGYQLGDIAEIYNPFAVMRAIKRRKIASYWTSTTTYESLKRYISMNYEGLRDSVIELLAGNEVRVDIKKFANDIHEINSRDAVLTLLIHLGYLSYNDTRETVRIPNYEVQREFERTMQDSNWGYVAKAIQNSDQLVQDTLDGKTEAVKRAIELVHQDKTSILQYNDENALAYVVSLAYVAACKDYTSMREFPSGKGFADIVFIPRRNVDKPAIVVELKYNHSAESGLEQIKERRYADSLREYVGDVVLVGISYDEKTKEHSCVIERMGNVQSSDENVPSSGKNVPSSNKDVPSSLLAISGLAAKDVRKAWLLLQVIGNETLSLKEILLRIKMANRSRFKQDVIDPLIEADLVDQLYKENNHPKQKYFITEKGKQL